jgi:hypothetical protein
VRIRQDDPLGLVNQLPPLDGLERPGLPREQVVDREIENLPQF